jgi:hypothetical protein
MPDFAKLQMPLKIILQQLKNGSWLSKFINHLDFRPILEISFVFG